MAEENNSIFLMLGRLEGKVDSFLAKHDEIKSHFDKKIDNHEERISTLEDDSNTADGAHKTIKYVIQLVFGVICAFGGAYFSKKVGG